MLKNWKVVSTAWTCTCVHFMLMWFTHEFIQYRIHGLSGVTWYNVPALHLTSELNIDHQSLTLHWIQPTVALSTVYPSFSLHTQVSPPFFTHSLHVWQKHSHSQWLCGALETFHYFNLQFLPWFYAVISVLLLYNPFVFCCNLDFF